MKLMYVRPRSTRVAIPWKREKVDVSFGDIIEGSPVLQKYGFMTIEKAKDHVKSKLISAKSQIQYQKQVGESTLNKIKEQLDRQMQSIKQKTEKNTAFYKKQVELYSSVSFEEKKAKKKQKKEE